MRVSEFLERLQQVKRNGNGWMALCPAHEDVEPSLSIRQGEDGRLLLKCFAGCSVEAVVHAIGLEVSDLFQDREGESSVSTSCTICKYAEAKGLPARFLVGLGLSDVTLKTGDAIRIPYFDENGNELATRYRLALSGRDKFRWRKGSKPFLYGLWRLDKEQDHVILCEGESDCHTLWFHGFNALGLPGASNWKEDRDTAHFENFTRIYIIQEPDQGGEAVLNWLQRSKIRERAYIVRLDGAKDPSELHLNDPEKFVTRFNDALGKAIPFNEYVEQNEKRREEDEESILQRLAQLSPIEYDRIREKEAAKLGIRVSTLDELVKSRRVKQTENQKAVIFEELDPWPSPVDGEQLLSEIKSVIQQHVILTEAQAVACALWSIHTYCLDCFNVAPLLALTSPEKRCGKTTLLSVLNGLVYKPLLASNITPAALFRVIQRYNPCLLIDEADTFIKDNDELRGVINSGHTKQTAFVIRVNTETLEPERFSTWGAKAIALIGKMPGTLQDRAIEIRLQRKLPGEKVEKIPLDFVKHMEPFRQKALRWVMDNTDAIKNARADVPDVGNDRAIDNWTPLFAIAEVTGREWPKLTKEAMIEIETKAETETIKQELLKDIKAVLNGREKISSKELVETLIEMEDRPWTEWKHGKPITQNTLAKLLRPFGIASKKIRIGNVTFRGYECHQFEDVFQRYLSSPAPPNQSGTMEQVNKLNNLGPNQSGTKGVNVPLSNQANPLKSLDCSTVPLSNQGGEGKHIEERKEMEHEERDGIPTGDENEPEQRLGCDDLTPEEELALFGETSNPRWEVL